MKFNKWTLGLAAVGVVSLASAVQAEEKSNPVMTALASTQISGYVDTSAVWRMGNNTSSLGAGGFNLVPGSVSAGKADGFNLNVVGLTIEKPLDEAEWAAGYKAELLFGPDATAWNTSVNAIAGAADYAIKQAYVTLRAPLGNGLDIKIGTFDEILGYESFNSYKNPNWSRSYGWAIEPTQQTGVLLSYKFSDVVSVAGGIANTYGTGINARPARAGFPAPLVSESEKTYMAAIALTAPESLGFLAGSTLYAGVVNGLNGGLTDTTSIYVGGTMNTPAECLKLGAAWDYRTTGGVGNGAFPLNSTYAHTLAGYVSWQATEKLKVLGRAEWAKGTWGTWYRVPGAFGIETDPKEQYMALTGTLDYSLWENVVTRLEFRWDRDLTDQHASAANAGPFGFDDNNNYFLALNVIYKF